MKKTKKNRQQLIKTAKRMKLVAADTSDYFVNGVKHADDFKVMLTFFRCCHKWSECLSFVSMCDSLACNRLSDVLWKRDTINNIIKNIDRLNDKTSTRQVADELFELWPRIAHGIADFMADLSRVIKKQPINITMLAENINTITGFAETLTITEHKYDEEYEGRYDIPDIDWPGIIKDGEVYFADDEDITDRNLDELCMIVSARLSRLYVELVNAAIPLASATMAFDSFQTRFNNNSDMVNRAFEMETKNGH